jgi:hypothetical protein
VLDRPDYVDLLGLVPGSQVGVTRTTFGALRRNGDLSSSKKDTKNDPSSSTWVISIAKSLGSFYEDDMPFQTFLLGSVIFFAGNNLMEHAIKGNNGAYFHKYVLSALCLSSHTGFDSTVVFCSVIDIVIVLNNRCRVYSIHL